MANNIKITGSIVNTTTVSRYSVEDTNLIASRNLQEDFGGTNDYIEYYVYDIVGNLLNTNYNYLSYKLPSTSGLTPAVSDLPNTRGKIQTTDVGIESTLAIPTSSLFPIIEIDPVKDLQDLGYTSGEFSVRYNFFQNKISNFINEALFVKTISQDRTEIALASTTLTNEQIQSASVDLISKINNSDYYVDYLLNFGDNIQYVAVNVALNPDPGGFEILFKLYQPLPLSIQEKQTLWIVEEQVSPYVFDINLDTLIIPPPPPQLRGPNFNIQIENQGTISTSYGSYSGLITSLKTLQSSSYNQIQNLLASQSIDINVDYTDFNNFVFFGSAEQRVKNFYTKVKEIEDYQNFINKYTPFVATTASLQTTINQYSSSITNAIRQFDGYETYLYYESSSYAWPKANSNKPFVLLSTGSATVQTWYNALTGSAETYDLNNYDNLEYAVPSFIKDDGNNQPFLTFLNMVGQYFDNIWIYIKSITDVNLANNNLEVGISKDLVYQQLKSLGVKLYNSQAGNSVADYLIGANTGSSIFDNNFTITGSYLNNIPRADLVAELYKRIYHNLPLLLKTKGTVAGLDYLMTTFGIPNRTYYTIYSGSNAITYYTPTGSAVTASILNVKEFGGATKAELLKGYNNDKVRLVTNTITGSVLSSELSLQTFPTASAVFRENDMHYVDISFSPETQMDAYVSGAIAATNPTWSLDDYIGDPRQQYLNTYPDLDAQRKLYFETGVPGFAPFTASALDYNGFIRLIEYFDNSLFKMLADFVPERASLSTGVTINSPVLERNKAVYSVPTAFTESVKDANYEIGAITPQYGELYDALQGDKSPFFTGELSGSTVNISQYFEDNYNPYLGDWNVWNAQHTISESININTFAHSDWNVLLNNVSQSVTSSVRRDIQYIYGTTGSITSSAELQDSYLSLTSYIDSRYNGSKVTSYTYNTYTPSSSVWPGDDSYGKTAAIDLNTFKVAWVKNIPSQSLNFIDKTSISLKYLVDASNNLTELSRGNFNLPEVQRIFRSGDNVVLSISDVKVPSNQTTLDGTKNIWKGGFSYDPLLFRENNETLNFTHPTPISSSQANLGLKAIGDIGLSYEAWAISNNPTQFIAAPPSEISTYGGGSPASNQYIYRKDNIIQTGPMASNRFEALSYRYAGNSNSLVNWNIGTIPAGSFIFPAIGPLQAQNATNRRQAYYFSILNINNTGSNVGGFNYEPNPNSYSIGNDGDYYYKAPRSSNNYEFKGQISFSFKGKISNGNRGISQPWWTAVFKPIGILEKCSSNQNPNNENNWSLIGATKIRRNSWPSNFAGGDNPDNNSIWFSLGMTEFASYYCDLNISNVQLNVNDLVRFRFYFVDISNILGFIAEGPSNQTLTPVSYFSFFFNNSNLSSTQVENSYFQVKDLNAPTTIYTYDSSYGQIPQLFTTSSVNTLLFHSSSLYLFNSASIYNPQAPTSQYYTPVVDNFGIQKYDLIRIGGFESPASTYYEVTNVSSSTNGVYVTLNSNINTGSFISDIAQNFAIFRPKQDETSVIINYKKQPGEVSQTILIPFDASNTIKDAVGNIFKTLNPDLQ